MYAVGSRFVLCFWGRIYVFVCVFGGGGGEEGGCTVLFSVSVCPLWGFVLEPEFC